MSTNFNLGSAMRQQNRGVSYEFQWMIDAGDAMIARRIGAYIHEGNPMGVRI